MLFDETNINYEFKRNTNNNTIYNADEGFNKGNMFKNIYSKYKDYVYKIDINNEKDNLLYNIQKYTFVLKDLILFLDLNPNNKEMLQEYNNNLQLLKEYTNKYETKYGEISAYTLKNVSQWNYSKNPWPWDKGEKYV